MSEPTLSLPASVNEHATLPKPDGPSPASPVPRSVGDYQLLKEIGRGGMGVVYSAMQPSLHRTVAIKMILVGSHAGSEEVSRFRREVEATAALQHPNIVQIHSVGEQDGVPYCALEYCGGGSLEQRLASNPMVPLEAARLLETLARTVHQAHAQGIIHRDLKPANILFSSDGTPKIGDFGLAKFVEQRRETLAKQTQSGAILGTPSYMAPEQAAGQSKDCNATTDVYALGAILYECLTGRPSFKAPTMLETLTQVVATEPVSPRDLQPAIPVDLETICLKCLQKSGPRRYASAQALADDLASFLTGRPIQARPVSRLEHAWRACRRNPLVSSLAAALMIVLLASTGVSTYFSLEARAALREKEAADRRSEEILARFYEWSRTHPEAMQQPNQREMWKQFFRDNPDFTVIDVRRAFFPNTQPDAQQPSPLSQAAPSGTRAQGSLDPKMIGD